MNLPVDVLQIIVSKTNNEEIKSLIIPDIWTEITSFSKSEQFWYLRVQHLLNRELTFIEPEEHSWKDIYYILEHVTSHNMNVLRTLDLCGDNTLLVSIMLQCGIDPSAEESPILNFCCTRGYDKIVHLLLREKNVEPKIIAMIDVNHPEIFKLLLADERTDLTHSDIVLEFACNSNHHEVVHLLLEDERIDPTGTGAYNGAIQGTS